MQNALQKVSDQIEAAHLSLVEEELNLTLKDKIPFLLCLLVVLAIIFTVAVIWKTS
ncbi:hypothetical protein G3142_005578 [Salmonella enterica subsp. enterica serovar Montevideo]|nr:hypothetical protein [Salmonella enterica subsp. enterica serovar Montevideo]EEK7814371.1 hypothetical protein [Salmonella enterica subsp. enterica serovar Montevideo]